jgi:hypothetical protein
MFDEIPLGPPPDADPRLPFDRPFTTAQAHDFGMSRSELRGLVSQAILRRLFVGVYVDSAVPVTQPMRAQALSLILPPSAVVTDETACWLHVGDLDPPGAHLTPQPLRVFQRPGHTRIRKAGCVGGERTLLPHDVQVIDGVPTTTALRTALDMGRLRPRDHAFAAMEALRRTDRFTTGELVASVPRFSGHRGVVQLRELAPLVDPRAQSQAESFTWLRCRDAGLPRLDRQVEVRRGGWGELAYLDMANVRQRFAVEYDGRDWHTSDAQVDHDRRRRKWVREQEGYGFAILRREHVYGVPRHVTAQVVAEEWHRHCAGG